ncbi:hypothetical protein N2152v2_001362 [Parachlorella kessleri]
MCSRALTFEAASLGVAALSPEEHAGLPSKPPAAPPVFCAPERHGPLFNGGYLASLAEQEQPGSMPAQPPPLPPPPQQQQPTEGNQRRRRSSNDSLVVEVVDEASPPRPAPAGAEVELIPKQPLAEQEQQLGKRLSQEQQGASPYQWRDALEDFWRQQEQAEAKSLPSQSHPASRRASQQYPPQPPPLLPVAHIRRVDWRLDNLVPFTEAGAPPPVDGRGLAGYHTSWVDTFILRGNISVRETYNRALPLPVIGIISDTRKMLLRQHSEADPKAVTETMFSGHDRESFQGGRHRANVLRLSFLEHQMGNTIEGGPERVYTAYNWVQLLLAGRTREGGVGWKLPAPVTTNVFGLLSQCFASFEQCRKLVDTPFPFPWSQIIVAFLLMYTLTIPVMMAAYIKQVWLGVVLTFISVLTYWALNEVARDLEDPYIYDPNDLPLARHQKEFSAEEVTEVVLQGGKVARQGDAHYPITIGGRAVASRLVGKGSYAVVVNGFYIIEAVVVKVWEQAYAANSAQGGILAEAEALQLCPSVFPSLVGFHAGEPAVLIYRRYNMGSLEDAIRSKDLCPLLRCPFGLTTILTSVSFSMVKMDQAGIVHRDLKLDNIVLGMRDGQLEVSIADPGLATKHGKLVKGARSVGNSAAQPAEVYMDGPYGSVTHTSDVPAASTISAQLVLSLGLCLENWPKPYPSLQQLLIDALSNTDNLPLLITKQAIDLWQLDGSNSHHVIGCFIIVVVIILGMGLGPEDRLKPDEQYPPLHDVHVLWAADAGKYVSKMPQPLRDSLAKVYTSEHDLYEVIQKKTQKVPFNTFCPVDDRAPLPEEVLSLREMAARLQVPEAPVQDIYLDFTQPGWFSSTCPFMVDLWTYLSFITYNHGKQTVEELAAAVMQETVRIARAATGDPLFHQHAELQDALKKLAPAVELAWGGCHHGKKCYDDRVQDMVKVAWKMVGDLQVSPAVAERLKERAFENSAPTAAQASLAFTMAATSLFLNSAIHIAAYGIRAAAVNQGDCAAQLQELVLLIATACFAYEQCMRGLHDNPNLLAEVKALVTMATPTFCWATDQLGSLPLLAELPNAMLHLSCQLCVGVLPCTLEAAQTFLSSLIQPPQHAQKLWSLPGLVHHHAQSFPAAGFGPAQGAAASPLPSSELQAAAVALAPAAPAAAGAAHIAALMQCIAACADAAGPHGVPLSQTLHPPTACAAAAALAMAAPTTLPLPFIEHPSALQHVQHMQPPVLMLDQLPADLEHGTILLDKEQQQQKEGQQLEHKPNPLSPRNRAELESQKDARPPAKQRGLQQGVGSATPVPPMLAPQLPRPVSPSRLTRGRKQGVLPAIIENQELVAGMEAGMPTTAELQVPARIPGALSALTADLEGCTLGSAPSTGADTNGKSVSRRTVFARLRQGQGITRSATGTPAGEQEGGFQLASSAAAVGGTRRNSKRKTRCDSGMLPDLSKRASRASSQFVDEEDVRQYCLTGPVDKVGLQYSKPIGPRKLLESKWWAAASDISHAALDDDLVAEAFSTSQGIPLASLRKLKAKAKTSHKLLETRLAGSLVDPALAAGAGSVRLSATATASSTSTGQRARWSTFRVCSDFMGMLDSAGQPVAEGGLTLTQERDYRWRLLQSVKKYAADPINKAGIRPAGSGMVEARLNAEFAEEHGVRSGTGVWYVFRD